ncbi:unnamed protein product [Rangifer tarandus platyrhynchus]|uniref:Uncharacterized protein n=2 Tax=Rangifer tarandus platyrhynchus TaxID=3082113 RepID=A0ABN8ZXK9_RANTA|nr:unnamed protein product [Rangifer tarandus platyrhynchus]
MGTLKATLKPKYKVKRSNLQISTLLPSGRGAPLVELKPKVSQAYICWSPCTYNRPTFGVVFHTKTRGVHSIFCLTSWPWDHDSPAPFKVRMGSPHCIPASWQAFIPRKQTWNYSPSPHMAGVRQSLQRGGLGEDGSVSCQFPELLGEPGDVRTPPQGEVAL